MVTQELDSGSIQIMYVTSSEPKPIHNINNGSIIIEVDTGHAFRFDLENLLWHDVGYMKVVMV